MTAQSPWINRIDVYNSDDVDGTCNLTIWDSQGQPVVDLNYLVPANSKLTIVLPAGPSYIPAPGEIVLGAIEGSCAITTASARIKPKISFRYGNSLSLCEFFMPGTRSQEYVLPNSIQAHFVGAGIAVMNPLAIPISIRMMAFRQGVLVGDTGAMEITAHGKLVSISEGIWTCLGCGDFDQVKISSIQAPFPPPMSISWDQHQDRHVFFNGTSITAIQELPPPQGEFYGADSIVGDLMFIKAGTFIQGSPLEEPCHSSDEVQFTHILTRDIAVMATEVTRQMWAKLQAVQTSLPDDPTDTDYGQCKDNPVQSIDWRETVLFANLLSLHQGLTRCYYTDSSKLYPITANNHMGTEVYCDFNASGFRLPTEGEWEYFCRAGTLTPFSVNESNFTPSYCSSCTLGSLPILETVAVFCANDSDVTTEVASKLPNPWGLYDVHGNVWEWCWDRYDVYPTSSVTDYTGPSTGPYKSFRGGGWEYYPYACRSANRNSYSLGNRNRHVGFRLVRTVP